MQKTMLRIVGCMLALMTELALDAQIMRKDIGLSDPAILADPVTRKYYMTGTGGGLWVSDDLEIWNGLPAPARTADEAWMGARPEIWAPEIHYAGDKYYFLGTFTNHNAKSDANHPRRAVHVLGSSLPEGPYTLIAGADATYLPAAKTTLDGSLFTDTDGSRYLLYCHEWIQNGNGTVEAIRLKPDMSGTVGEPIVMFRAHDAHWNTDPVTDGPFAFRTQSGRLGIIWTSWRGDRYVQGVAYSASGTLAGPWQHQALPITPDNYGHGMLFRTFDGRLLLSIHSHRNIDLARQWFERHPTLFLMDDSGDALRAVMEYRADTDLRHPANVVVNNPEFEYDTLGWTNTTHAQNQLIATNQGGAITGKFFESWDPNSFTGEIYQTLRVPNGTYRLSAAAFRSQPLSGGNVDRESVCLFANDEQAAVVGTEPQTYRVTVCVTDGHLRFGLRSNKKKFRWMGIDNVQILYYGTDRYTSEDIDSAGDGRIYLRSMRDGRFLSAGNSWGTQAVLSPHAHDFLISKLPDGRIVLDSRISNGGGNHYVGANGYVDAPPAPFTMTNVGDDIVTLTADGVNYWGNTGGLVASTSMKNAALRGARWQVLTHADLLGELKHATASKPADATFLIADPNFGRNDTRIGEWQGDLHTGGDVTNQWAEASATTFDINQTISGIPNGTYELHVQGFYRYGALANARKAHADGRERIDAMLYAGSTALPLKSICDVTGSIPTTLDEASAKFTAGAYRLTIRTFVSNGTLRIGVRKNRGDTPADGWTVFDNFELYYLGMADVTGISLPTIHNDKSTSAYDLSGLNIGERPLAGRVGIYIENGKKHIHKVYNR